VRLTWEVGDGKDVYPETVEGEGVGEGVAGWVLRGLQMRVLSFEAKAETRLLFGWRSSAGTGTSESTSKPSRPSPSWNSSQSPPGGDMPRKRLIIMSVGISCFEALVFLLPLDSPRAFVGRSETVSPSVIISSSTSYLDVLLISRYFFTPGQATAFPCTASEPILTLQVCGHFFSLCISSFSMDVK